MKINKITIRGEKQPSQPTPDASDDLKLEEVYLLGSTTRGETERHTITLKKDQLVEFVFEDNTVWLSSDETIQDIFPEAAAIKSRSVDSDPMAIGFTIKIFIAVGTNCSKIFMAHFI